MKVYVVLFSPVGENHQYIGVIFSTEKAAQAFLRTKANDPSYTYEMEEWEVQT